jgi:hypothetical protein
MGRMVQASRSTCLRDDEVVDVEELSEALAREVALDGPCKRVSTVVML